MNVSIRHAKSADFGVIADLLNELGFPASKKEVGARLKVVESLTTDAVFVAVAAGKVVGCLSLHVMPYFTSGNRVCRVMTLVVQEAMRNQGIGKELIRTAEVFAREVGCSAIEVTSADYREDAHRFYTRLGYPKTSVKFFKEIDP
jgi:N-acetylglutamate synthase-like GNAT family acetyltransferase